MEHGFYHPSRGYWQAIGGDPAVLLLSYPTGTIQVSLKPSADHEWQDGQWVYYEPEPVPEPVPATISRRQFYDGLAEAGRISKAEALAAMKTGAIPVALQAILDGMTDDGARYKAEMKLIGATDFMRDDPLVMVVAITQGMSEAEVDQFWRDCYAL